VITQEKDTYYTTLGYRISKIRFELRLNKKQFAEKLKISQPSVSRYENNEREPDYNFLLSLFKELDVSPDFIFGFSEIIFRK
jgi:transcriptional regulator with XRE-family HTH domain